MTVTPTAEEITCLAELLYEAARVRFGEERAEVLRPTIQQGAEYLAVVSSFRVVPEDEVCLRAPLPDPARAVSVEAEPGTRR
jgi:hypothetical protein